MRIYTPLCRNSNDRVVSWCVLQTPEHLKSRIGEEAFNPNGLAQRTISLLKDKYPDLEVNLDP